MNEEGVTFLDEILHEPSAMVQYIDLLDDHRAGVIRSLNDTWMNLLVRYRQAEYSLLTNYRIKPHVRNVSVSTTTAPKKKSLHGVGRKKTKKNVLTIRK